MTDSERGARVRFPPPLIFALSTLAGVAVHYSVHSGHVPIARTASLVAGIAVIVLGVSLVLSARIWFVRTGQSPVPWKPTPSLIAEGPYRFTRNPMYVGVTLIQIGLGLALDIAWVSLFAPLSLLVVHWIAVVREEEYLAGKFGAAYDAYRARVRRYL
jgi:protein-S-isoprenylcysteine O-methyltransferase Ste14